MRYPATLKYWLLAIRPKTLSIAVVPVLIGSALAWNQTGVLVWPVLLAALMAALLIQVGTNLHNDAADFERGADCSATRLGPTRVTAQGWLTAAQVHCGAWFSFGMAMLFGMYLIQVGGWPILTIGLFSIAAAWAYTGGPQPIAYTGFGEFFVWLFFGVIAVAGSYYLQTKQLSWPTVLTGVLVGMPAAAVLVVNNYRDLDNDKLVGKNTSAVQWGRKASQLEYALLMLLPFALLPLLSLLGVGGWGWALPYLCLPLALNLVKRFRCEPPGPAFNPLLAATARLQLIWGGLLYVGLLLVHPAR
ncbi:MAG: 1,4-dihydroxy-2-naphthoate polyprenyltransferase [Candidatus Competibacteraceae bacterium]|nr:1,4-dihydroxy-2-naphthoate polyprenyltransferase [Candidatus Competibacteraceae bacterium]